MVPTTETKAVHCMSVAAATLAQMARASGQHARAQELINLSLEYWRRVAWEIEG